jgi:hypothetical protein
LSAEDIDCQQAQEHILKAASSYMSKGNKASDDAKDNLSFVGDSVKLTKEERMLVVQRLHNLHETFASLSHWTSLFTTMLERNGVSVNSSFFEKKYPGGAYALNWMMDGIFEGETESRNAKMKAAYDAVLGENHPGPLVKRKKTYYTDGGKMIDKLLTPSPEEKEIMVTNLLDQKKEGDSTDEEDEN